MFFRFRRTADNAMRKRRSPVARDRLTLVPSLLKGTLSATSDHPSLLLFTVHKCASDYVGKMLSQIAVSQSIIPIDLDGFAASTADRTSADVRAISFSKFGRQEHASLPPDQVRQFEEFFRTRGFLFGPFRSPRLAERLPHVRSFKKLLMLRDPRDVLTSKYFSFAYSHPAPGNPDRLPAFLKKRQATLQTNVDEFVLHSVKGEAKKYRRYCDSWLPGEDSLLVKYEDMVTDFPAWLSQVLAFWGLELDQRTITMIVKSASFQVDNENIYSHKRQVTPGDHRRKLKPQTIEQLDNELGDVLDRLGYPRYSAELHAPDRRESCPC